VFPRLVGTAIADRDATITAIQRLQHLVIFLTLALAFVIVPWINQLMGFWLGNTLMNEAANVVIIGAIGVALASSATISMMAINSLGHTRHIAVLHMIEFPIYCFILYLASVQASLWIVQVAWITRLAIDAIGMNLILRSMGTNDAGRTPRFSLSTIRGAFDKVLRGQMALMALTAALIALASQRTHIPVLWVCLCSLAGAVVSTTISLQNVRQTLAWLRHPPTALTPSNTN